MGSITFDQIRGPIERVLYVTLGYLAAKGYIGTDQVGNYAALILGVSAAFYGWWQNRPKAILQSASALSDVKQITTTDTALAADTSLPKVTSVGGAAPTPETKGN